MQCGSGWRSMTALRRSVCLAVGVVLVALSGQVAWAAPGDMTLVSRQASESAHMDQQFDPGTSERVEELFDRLSFHSRWWRAAWPCLAQCLIGAVGYSRLQLWRLALRASQSILARPP